MSGDRTKDVHGRLTADYRPGMRNVARAWLRCWAASGSSAMATALAAKIGLSLKAVAEHLSDLADIGLIRRGPRGPAAWTGATPGDGVDPAAMLALLGPPEDVTRVARPLQRRRCPTCGRVHVGRQNACDACEAAAADPALGVRLDYYAARVAAGLPLFGPAGGEAGYETPAWCRPLEDNPPGVVPAGEDEGGDDA